MISGSIAIDRIMNFSGRYKDVIKPEKIHVLSLSVLLKALQTTEGGVGANIAYTLALLGESPVLIGSVGNDAKQYIRKLQSLGVDISKIHTSLLPTASFNVITDLDDNQVGGFYPGAMADPNKLSLENTHAHTIFVVSPDDPSVMAHYVSECVKHKVRMVYDFGQQVSNMSPSFLKRGVWNAEVIIANDYEMAVLSEKIGKSLKEIISHVPVCVTTLGEKGSIMQGTKVKKTVRISPAHAKKVIDPTGAGDAYRAGFLYGYIRDFDLQVCGQIASLAAVYAIESMGTQNHHFTQKEFAKRYAAHYHQSLEIFM